MNIFNMRTRPHGIERGAQFLSENFISIGWPKISTLEKVTKDEIRKRLESKYLYTGHTLGHALGQVNAFVNTMQPNDIVIIKYNDLAHIGIVGEYTYYPQYDNVTEGMCHQRPVEWKEHIPVRSLTENIQKFMKNRNTIAKYPDPIDEFDLDLFIERQPILSASELSRVDSLFETALSILEAELQSEDPDRRIKAATELIRLKGKQQ